jgi:hypothetical protein
MVDSGQLIGELRGQIPPDLLALLLQLQQAEGNETSNIADDIRYGFDRQSLRPARLVIAALQTSIAQELQAVTPLLADVLEEDQATMEAQQASLILLALFAPDTPLLKERLFFTWAAKLQP